MLLSLYVDTGVHPETRGCPSDFCEKMEDLKVGLSKCDFCFECRSKVLRAVTEGELTLKQMVAIYKILDFVVSRRNCFVIMPFDRRFDRIYNECIKPALINRNWICNRADEIYESKVVMNLIWEWILRADLIVADLTGRNANVFYELGYAHALNKNTILITQSIDDVPFDLRHLQLIEYSMTPKGLRNLKEAIVKYF